MDKPTSLFVQCTMIKKETNKLIGLVHPFQTSLIFATQASAHVINSKGNKILGHTPKAWTDQKRLTRGQAL
jgi:hypothetical protein